VRIRQANKIVRRCLQPGESAYAVKMRSKVDMAVNTRHKRKNRRESRSLGIQIHASVPLQFAAKLFDAYREFHRAVVNEAIARLNIPASIVVGAATNANYSSAMITAKNLSPLLCDAELSDEPEGKVNPDWEDMDWEPSDRICPDCKRRVWEAPWTDDSPENGGACIGTLYECGSCGWSDSN
jgi:hypothetical protein